MNFIHSIKMGILVAFPCSIISGFADSGNNTDLNNIKEMLTGYKPVTWVFIGDSVTHGAKHTNGYRSYPEHFAERIRYELKRKADPVINMGISSSTTENLLHNFSWCVERFKPDVVSIMIGINDAGKGKTGLETFRKNLKDLVRSVRKINAIPILNTPNMTNPDTHPKDLSAYVEIIREVAENNNVLLVDHYAHWKIQKPKKEQLLKWLADKAVHPNEFGHREMAKEIFRTLGIYSDKSLTCNLLVP